MSIIANEVVEKEYAEYEAPIVESVILPEDIEREVAYAGVMVISQNQNQVVA